MDHCHSDNGNDTTSTDSAINQAVIRWAEGCFESDACVFCLVLIPSSMLRLPLLLAQPDSIVVARQCLSRQTSYYFKQDMIAFMRAKASLSKFRDMQVICKVTTRCWLNSSKQRWTCSTCGKTYLLTNEKSMFHVLLEYSLLNDQYWIWLMPYYSQLWMESRVVCRHGFYVRNLQLVCSDRSGHVQQGFVRDQTESKWYRYGRSPINPASNKLRGEFSDNDSIFSKKAHRIRENEQWF